MYLATIFINLVVFTILSVFDIKHRIAPNYITIPYMLFGIGILFIDHTRIQYLLNTLEVSVILVILFIYSRLRGKNLTDMFGGGDVKVLIGFSLMSDFYTFNLSLITGTLIGIIWAKVNSKNSIPFIPFLSSGYVIALVVDFVIKQVRFGWYQVSSLL
ncbi:MAG: A24 family peptidase [Spirochaetia bacterium]|nr:A24 family peptidase [Spirochaetota bacterium]MCX8096880.1 A24 family peptidase [Spirochaetota bacterium]MDW8112997.1 A24 family peptidase [Spirochaetia bacterium]